MICDVSEDGWCSRHKTHHVGRLRELALMDAVLGESYRQLWARQMEPQPGPKIRRRTDCTHLGQLLEKGVGCGSQDIYACAVHGKATMAPCQHHHTCMAGVPNECKEYQARARKLRLVNRLSPGDCLVMTAAIECLHEQHPGKYQTAIGVPTGCEALFLHNPHVSAMPAGEAWEEIVVQYPLVHQSNSRPVHFLQGYVEFLAERLKIPLRLTTNRPHLYLSQEEKTWMPQVEEVLKRKARYWVIGAGFKKDFTAKHYPYYQEVVDKLRGKVFFVQVGAAEHVHQPLKNVLNLIGKTDLRQLVRLVYHAEGVVCGLTLLMHIAAAFQKPAVIVAGGREPRSWNSYPRQALLANVGALDCCATGACWKTRVVPLDDGDDAKHSFCLQPVMVEPPMPRCMAIISPTEIATAVEGYYSGGAVSLK